jgi:hypothetical protein
LQVQEKTTSWTKDLKFDWGKKSIMADGREVLEESKMEKRAVES